MPLRCYEQTLNRFLSADTIVPDPANPQSFNRYSYGYNNPVKYFDPTGHVVELPCWVLCPGDDPIDIGGWSWIGQRAAQFGCTFLLPCNVDLEQGVINPLSPQQHVDYQTGQLMGIGGPLAVVSPGASQSGGVIRKFAQNLLDKFDDFISNVDPRWGSTWKAFAQANPNKVVVGLVDDEIAGAAMYTTHTDPNVSALIGNKDALYFMGLEVGSDYRGSGIGTDLLKAILQESADLGYEGRVYGYILADDPNALQWIINRGATILDEGSRLFYFDEATAANILNGGSIARNRGDEIIKRKN